MIIRAGRNIYPHEVEDFIGRMQGVRKGCVAAIASADPQSGSERLVVLAETRLQSSQDLATLKGKIREASLEILDLPPDEVVLTPPHAIPKTSSGKIRRSAAKALFEAGALGEKPQSLWWQIARLEYIGALDRLRRSFRSALSLFYAGYWWFVLALIAVVVWPVVMMLPRRTWRHAFVRVAIQLWFFLTGITTDVSMRGRANPDRAIIVSNHASYLDGAVLSVAIPRMLTFIAKQEFSGQFWAGQFLKRLGTIFVRRVDRVEGVKAAEEIVAAAMTGERIVTFPEGTLLRRPGLLSFRLGAFAAACEAGVAIVPISISGTRTVLRGEQWFPRRGPISVEIGEAIFPDGKGFEAAVQLRDKARAWILDRCGEPDLSGEDVDLAAWGQL